MLSFFDSVDIGTEALIIPYRYGLPVFVVVSDLFELVVFTELGALTGFQERFENGILVWQGGLHTFPDTGMHIGSKGFG
jgi:hypothetical protein